METLIKSHYTDIRNICFFIARTYKLSPDDLFQDVLEKLWRFRDKYMSRKNASFTTFMYKVATHAAIDHKRKMHIQYVVMSELQIVQQICESFEQQIIDHDNRKYILKRIHMLYGDLAYTMITMMHDGYRYKHLYDFMKKEMPEHSDGYRAIKARLYRQLQQIKTEINQTKHI